MIQHLLKLIWIQRRQNAWIVAELFIVFILLWYIMDFFITLGYTSSIANSYDIKDTYQVQLATLPQSSPQYVRYEEESQQAATDFQTILERIRQHPQVESVCVSNMSAPYCASYRNTGVSKDTTKTVSRHYLEVTPSYFEVFRIHPLAGGNPSQLAETLKEKSVIISRLFAQDEFPGEQAKGKTLYFQGNDDEYIVGDVCGPLKRDDYRPEEYAVYVLLSNADIAQMDEGTLSGFEISIRVKPGLNEREFIQNFQQDMREQLAVGNYMLYKVRSFDDLRYTLYLSDGRMDAIRYRVAFMVFLIFNIFLGIIGTFWFRNEYRKPEIGLRLAVGATRSQILRMMIGEGWLLLSLVAIPAVIICINLAKMEFIGTSIMHITFFRIFSGLLLTYLFMALVILLGAWYPAYLSSRIAPADTLRSE